MNRSRRAGWTATALLAAWGFSACSTNPATGERELSFIGEGREVQMGREADPQIASSMGLYADEAVQRYVDSIGQRLAAVSERPGLPWTFRVIDDPTVNAFAVPGGFIYVTRGILTHLNSEAELAGVLGHEIGHVTARHSVGQMSRAQLAQVGLGLGMIFVPELRPFGDLAGAGLQMLFLSYGRDDENQADELGVRYLRRTGYEPTELAEVMRMLDRTGQTQEGSGRIPEWLSTHPNPANRVENILAEVRDTRDAGGSRESVVGRDEFLRRLDGMVFGLNPREGYFEGTTFMQPDLRFRFEFPIGWQAVNQKQAVQGMSPDQDAGIMISIDEGEPEGAMRRFAADPEVRMYPTRQRTINGLPAMTAEFAAATEQEILRGLVAFFAHEGTTYRVLGYAPEARWATHARAISNALESFAHLTDPTALAVEPWRVDVVEAPSAMSLSLFLQRYPSSAGPEVVALINHLDGDGQLSAGSLYKRIIGGR